MFRFMLAYCVVFITQLYPVSHAQTAYLRSNQIFSGDIAELIVEYDNKIPSLYALDTSALESDFEVLDIRSSVSRMFEANEAFHRMRWIIEILPRRNGNLRIPSLQVGDIFTPVLTLEVVPPSPELSSSSNVYVELQAQPEDPYVGQQIQIVMRVIYNIALFDGDLLDPEIENADTYRTGLESTHSIFRDGTEFQVLERNLTIIARTPGEIRVPPAIYRGSIKSDESASAPDSTAQSRRINRASAALHLQVRIPPPEFSGGNWLPARQLELHQQWDKTNAELQVGDSLGLTLSIEAKGVAAEALPAGLLSVDSEKVKIYADQELRTNRFDGRELVGRLDQRFVVVITKPGEISIPMTLLKWWDVEQEVEKVATLDGKRWTVPTPTTGQRGNNAVEKPPQELVITAIRSNWPWYTGIAATLLIIGLLICVESLRDRLRATMEVILASPRNRKMLKQACISNDAAAAHRELIKWGRACWPRDAINGLHQVRIRTKSSELVEELSILDAALYADHGSDWQGRQLWRLVAAERRQLSEGHAAQENSLPDLYPQRS